MLATHATASPAAALPVSAGAASSVAVALAFPTAATVVSSVTVAVARLDIVSFGALLRQLFLPQLRCFVALMTLAAFFRLLLPSPRELLLQTPCRYTVGSGK